MSSMVQASPGGVWYAGVAELPARVPGASGRVVGVLTNVVVPGAQVVAAKAEALISLLHSMQ
ncbi:MAG: hypothetical protein ACT4P7_00745 [Gemmatimonadaceae bacterium]